MYFSYKCIIKLHARCKTIENNDILVTYNFISFLDTFRLPKDYSITCSANNNNNIRHVKKDIDAIATLRHPQKRQFKKLNGYHLQSHGVIYGEKVNSTVHKAKKKYPQLFLNSGVEQVSKKTSRSHIDPSLGDTKDLENLHDESLPSSSCKSRTASKKVKIWV